MVMVVKGRALGHQLARSRVKRIPSRSVVQHLTIPIGIPVSEAILVAIANIMASSHWAVAPTELVIVGSISLSWGMHIKVIPMAVMSMGAMAIDVRSMPQVVVRLGHQLARSRVKRISSRSVVQHLTISIGIPVSEAILVAVANIMASSNWAVASTELVIIGSISLSWGMHIVIPIVIQAIPMAVMSIGAMAIDVRSMPQVVVRLGHQLARSRVKRISSRSVVQHLAISIGIPMSEAILVAIANIMASSHWAVASTELVIVGSISLSWGMHIKVIPMAVMSIGAMAIDIRSMPQVVVRLGHQLARSRVKRISSRSVVQHLAISIGIPVPEAILVAIANIVASSHWAVASTELVIVGSISLS